MERIDIEIKDINLIMLDNHVVKVKFNIDVKNGHHKLNLVYEVDMEPMKLNEDIDINLLERNTIRIIKETIKYCVERGLKLRLKNIPVKFELDIVEEIDLKIIKINDGIWTLNYFVNNYFKALSKFIERTIKKLKVERLNIKE